MKTKTRIDKRYVRNRGVRTTEIIRDNHLVGLVVGKDDWWVVWAVRDGIEHKLERVASHETREGAESYFDE